MELHEWMETIGLALILISVGWEVFILPAFADWAAGFDAFAIHAKLDILWKHLAPRVENLTGEIGGAATIRSEYEGEWEKASRAGAQPQRVTGIVRVIGGTLFFTGSVLTLVAKLLVYWPR